MNKKLWSFINSGGAGYSSAAQSVFTNIGGSLSGAVKTAIAAFVDAEVAAGRWTNNLDVFQLYGTALGSEAQGLKNWISSSFTATNPNGHTATVNGYDFAGSGTSGVLTNYNPTTGTLYTASNAMQGVYLNRNDSSTDQKVILGYSGIDGWYQRTVASRLDFNNVVTNNLGAVQVAGYASGYTQGLYVGAVEVEINPNYRMRIYKDGTSVGLGSASIPTELNQSMMIGGRGAGGAPFDGVLSCYFAGAGASFSQSQFFTNFSTLITALGVKI